MNMKNSDDWKESYAGRHVTITGAAGTVGRELAVKLTQTDVAEIRLIDHAESALFDLEMSMDDKRIHCFVVDAQNESQLNRFINGSQDLFHCAAYKHVPACERNPRAAVENNIVAVQNVITAARQNKLERVIFTSSDKAVNPTNVMGTSKLMGERLITAANTLDIKNETIFASTRFGNVLGSSGSVIPVFRNQIMKGQPITVTHEDMTRFVMTKEDAAILVLRSLRLAKGGEVFVTKMPTLNIAHLGRRLAHLLRPDEKPIDPKFVGIRAGEKLYEELMTDEELARTHEIDQFFAVLPAFRNIYERIDYSSYEKAGKQPTDPYRSDQQPLMDDAAVDELLKQVLAEED